MLMETKERAGSRLSRPDDQMGIAGSGFLQASRFIFAWNSFVPDQTEPRTAVAGLHDPVSRQQQTTKQKSSS
jgi:hypothetical protein